MRGYGGDRTILGLPVVGDMWQNYIQGNTHVNTNETGDIPIISGGCQVTYLSGDKFLPICKFTPLGKFG